MSTYSTSHQGPDRGKVYDERYGRGYTFSMWSEVERPLLESIFDEFGGQGRSCLDFACGTGRITELLAGRFGSVTGVDISADMLEIAEGKCPEVDFREGDLLGNPDLVGTFDVITSFRFFPNAEPELRRLAMRSLVSHLEPGGIMIVNNHQNENSLLGRMRRLKPRLKRDFMAPDFMPNLLREHGLEIVRNHGFGFVPVWRDAAWVPSGAISGFERRLITRGRGLGWASNIVHVARRGDGA